MVGDGRKRGGVVSRCHTPAQLRRVGIRATFGAIKAGNQRRAASDRHDEHTLY